MIKNIVIDCDGVLTDGGKIVDENGERTHIKFHSRDNTAIKALITKGYRVIIVTASRFPGIRRYWMKYNVEVYSMPAKKSFIDNEAGIGYDETLGVGDDLMDSAFLAMCERSFVVNDAHPAMKRRFNVLETKGGKGVMSEIHDILVSKYKLTENSTVA